MYLVFRTKSLSTGISISDANKKKDWVGPEGVRFILVDLNIPLGAIRRSIDMDIPCIIFLQSVAC